MKALTLEHLSFAYLPELPIFRQLSCTLARCAEGEGRVVALMGASGAGKSTLLKLILQTLKPDQGRIVTEPKAPLIAYVPQEAVLFDHLSPLENARYFERVAFYRGSFDSQLFDSLSERLGMSDLLRTAKRIDQLSGGQKQRLLLLRAMSVRPDILLLDEPTTGLDAEVKLNFLNELRAIVMSQQILAVYVTHHRLEAEFVADEIAFLEAGENGIELFQDSVADFIRRPPVLDAVRIFNYPTPNILHYRPGSQGGLGEVSPADTGYHLAVAPEQVRFGTEGVDFRIVASNPIYTTISLAGQQLTVRTNDQVFAHTKCHFEGEILLYAKGRFDQLIKL